MSFEKSLLSVVICTHNPRPDYLMRVLKALENQTLARDCWELLLVDNASDKLLSAEVDIGSYPLARHIREDKLGLTPARLRGIQESQGEVLVFVDDDNVLNLDYLEIVLRIHKEWPMLGAWGGQIYPEFEEQPADWTKPYLGMLALREFKQDRWSNSLHDHETTPCGAGLCVRKIVADTYFEAVSVQASRLSLDRKGKALTSGGDFDLACTACDLELGKGIFKDLKLLHLIPAFRVQESYLLKLQEEISYSGVMLSFLREKLIPKTTWLTRMKQTFQYHQKSSIERRFSKASRRGFARALREINAIS